ncbi:sensor histidine kinase [Alteromonas sp. BMJM2]|uniref:sensor histidine kinase n=1 Tax=Alteromonas sp. BMJM2 TaxID=2954241 RepID=UPI0022B4B566|nr:sensor histidine kinase [Alteromonas sp. BMJM2]
MKLSQLRMAPEQSGAIITILVVAATNAWLLAGSERVGVTNFVAIMLCFALFSVGFWLVTQDKPFRHEQWARVALVGMEYALVLLLFSLSPITFNAILLVIWSAVLPYFMPFKRALLLSPLWSALPWLVFGWVWQSNSSLWINALLFWTFNLFALVMMESRKNAERQTQRAEEANRELRALQDLMQQASRKEERTRIARDIHDLVGHHLTGLSLHLQVASRTASPDQRPAIDQCLGIARLLLADVREAVSDMREFGQLNLLQALEALTEPLKNKIQVNIDCQTNINHLTLLQATNLLRCIQESLTNTMRHSRANEFAISIYSNANQLHIDIKDNGGSSSASLSVNNVVQGNGLKGIEERMSELNGTAAFSNSSTGFHTLLALPEAK